MSSATASHEGREDCPEQWEAECEKKTVLGYHSFALSPSFLITRPPTCLHTHFPTRSCTHLEPLEAECEKKTVLGYHSFTLSPSFLIAPPPTCLCTHLHTRSHAHLEPVEAECNKKPRWLP